MLIHTRIQPNIRMVATVVLFATALAALAACGPSASATKPSSTATATETIVVPPGWRLYSDPDGSFRLAMPADWTVTRGTTISNISGPGYAVALQDTETMLSGPYASMYLHVSPVSSDDYRKHGLCPHWRPDTTLAGLPAQHVQSRRAPHYWIIYRNDEEISVQYDAPLDPSQYMGPTPPTPLPTATASAAVNHLVQMLASLRVKPDAPIAC